MWLGCGCRREEVTCEQAGKVLRLMEVKEPKEASAAGREERSHGWGWACRAPDQRAVTGVRFQKATLAAAGRRHIPQPTASICSHREDQEPGLGR